MLPFFNFFVQKNMFGQAEKLLNLREAPRHAWTRWSRTYIAYSSSYVKHEHRLPLSVQSVHEAADSRDTKGRARKMASRCIHVVFIEKLFHC